MSSRETGSLCYDFLAPRRITFGWGRRVEVGAMARGLGRRAFLVVGSRTLQRNGVIAELAESLRTEGVEPLEIATISREPEVGDVDLAVVNLLGHGIREDDLVLAIGGGSAIDLAKAVAAMATNRHGASVRDFLEGVGRGLKIERAPLPMIAMPTTAGTGSEATKNAVISSYDPPFKKSLRSDLMTPRAVLIDPELGVTTPATTTAHTGMDAITQLIESFLSRRSQPIPRALAIEGLRLAAPAIATAVRDPTSREAREAMAHAALLSGMALANSGLGMAHGVAAALGVHCRTPHGLACAVMLPTALRVNREVCETALAQLAEPLTGRCFRSESAAADETLSAVERLRREVNIPGRLSEIGVKPEQIPAIVASSRGNSMSGNPRELSDKQLHGILEAML